MKLSDQPIKINIPWAQNAGSAYVQEVPDASQIGVTAGAASWNDGYVPLNLTPKASGGVPPSGQQTNGALRRISAWVRYIMAAGVVPYDATWQAANGGYPLNAAVSTSYTGASGSTGTLGRIWVSLVDGNMTNPDVGGAGWTSLVTSADNAFIIGADTGSAGAITVASPLPAVAALRVGTTLVAGPAAVNAGPTTINLAGLGAKPVIYPNGSPFLGGETQPRPQVFIYDGASWEWQGQQSPVLQQATTFYVNGSTSSVTSNGITYAPGSDANNGLTPATPFKTLQRAAGFVSGLNVNGQGVTVNVADGTYAPVSFSGAVNGSVTFIGDPATPSNCVISTSTVSACVSALNNTQVTLNGFRVTNTSANGIGFYSNRYSLLYFQNIDFGPCGLTHNLCDNGTINCIGNYGISGAAPSHVSLTAGTFIQTPSYANTVTITGSILFGTAYLLGTNLGFFRANTNTTFTTGGRGYRYSLNGNAVANTSGAGANFLPGDAAGATATGGQYL